jgi:hypothetical protein
MKKKKKAGMEKGLFVYLTIRLLGVNRRGPSFYINLHHYSSLSLLFSLYKFTFDLFFLCLVLFIACICSSNLLFSYGADFCFFYIHIPMVFISVCPWLSMLLKNCCLSFFPHSTSPWEIGSELWLVFYLTHFSKQ